MTTGRLSLEDFSEATQPVAQPTPAAAEPPVDLAALEAKAEAERVESYEAGYKSGWDDAVRAAEEERTQLSEELARNLRDVNFTYFEARDDLATSMRAFLRELVDTLFPELLPEAAASAVAEALAAIAQDASDGGVALSVSTEDAETVQSLLPLPDGVEVTILPEPALAPGQARLRAAHSEFSVDADRVVALLRNALSANRETEEGAAHG